MNFIKIDKELPPEGATVLARLIYNTKSSDYHYDELIYHKKRFIKRDGSICQEVVGWMPLREINSIELK